MHARRIICFALGMWLAAGLTIVVVAEENLRSADRLARHMSPAAAVRLEGLDHDTARLLLRYGISEENRSISEIWETIQLCGGTILLFFLVFGTAEDKSAILLAFIPFVLTCLERFWLTPAITAGGRILDFQNADAIAHQSRFAALNTAYLGVELVKFLVIALLAARLIAAHRPQSTESRALRDAIEPGTFRSRRSAEGLHDSPRP
jgi:hypothetical protein